MIPNAEVRMLYTTDDTEKTVFLGWMSQISDAAAGLKSAVAEVKLRGGTNMRVEALNREGDVIYSARVREDG